MYDYYGGWVESTRIYTFFFEPSVYSIFCIFMYIWVFYVLKSKKKYIYLFHKKPWAAIIRQGQYGPVHCHMWRLGLWLTDDSLHQYPRQRHGPLRARPACDCEPGC